MFRIGIFTANSLIGVITFIPNVMLSDSETERAERAAFYGVSASAAFITAGITGLFNVANASVGLTGLAICLQITALTIISKK